MTRLLVAASAITLLLALPAAAQTGSPGTGNPAGMRPGTPQAAPGVPAPHEPNHVDRLFVRQATLGGMAEVELGKLAAQKGHDDSVKRFGQRMVQDHGKANDRLAALAKAAGIALPDALHPEDKDMHDRLSKASGATFDNAYITGQVVSHQQTVQLLQHQIGAGQDEALKHFAVETLPIFLEHLQMAQDIHSRVARQSPQVSAAPRAAEPRSGESRDQGAAEHRETEELNRQQLQKPSEEAPPGSPR
jgi:putative membrane protein